MENGAGQESEYRVLARKYRPSDFDGLIGQEAMVRTLSNAIEAGRLAHAFVLTGVRGVGKTTTARIMAKALNCQSFDGPTMTPCGICDACVSISESRHVDVLEMDAASRTGVDDVREIIDSVRYAPVSARYKVYIIDEVHMLTKQAFNALLKTLEEPPAHVKFIFATTEIRKLPVTVLSRCQRFDLRRIEPDVLVGHLKGIADKEGADIDDGALAMIARAAEGSVRDSLSLLDQAIAHGGGHVAGDAVRDMLGLADRGQILDLFEQVMKGETAAALDNLRRQYDRGADPIVVLSDLLDVAHWLTRLKVIPDAGEDALASPAERDQGRDMAAKLAMPALTRAWQMLLKGLGETRTAPSPIAAAEMVLIRLAFAADLPNPADLVKQLKQNGGAGAPAAGSPHGTAGPGAPGPGPSAMTGSAAAPPMSGTGPARMTATGATTGSVSGSVSGTASGPATGTVSGLATETVSGAAVVAIRPDAAPETTAPFPPPATYEGLVDLFRSNKEVPLAVVLSDHVRLVAYAPGRITLNPSARAPADLSLRMKQCLKTWTGMDWTIAFSSEGGDASLREQAQARQQQIRDEAMAHPLVRSVLDVWPEAELISVREERVDTVDAPPDAPSDTGEAAYDDMGDAALDDLFDL